MKNLKNKKGISLIVLVITIIVMIILATAIILSLDSSNIVEKAKEAKTASDLANAKNVVILARGEYELGKGNDKTFAEYAESKLLEAGYKVNENDGLNVSENGVVSKVYVGSDNRKAIIPEGFTVSTKSTEDTVTEGLVIIDEKSNEFVWVPVDDFSKFERTTTYDGTITAPGSSYSEPFSGPTNNGVTLSLVNDLTGEWNEYLAMRASVKENKGFYIARYEAGKEGTDTLVSKKDVDVWQSVAWGESATEVGKEGAVYYSRKMYGGSASVISTLIYGVQWDSALQFIAKTDADYPLDSSNKGNHTEPISKTGHYHINNIYDMAGNINEWTMEGYLDGAHKIMRGGFYPAPGDVISAAARREYILSESPTVDGPAGFRVALYLK